MLIDCEIALEKIPLTTDFEKWFIVDLEYTVKTMQSMYRLLPPEATY